MTPFLFLVAGQAKTPVHPGRKAVLPVAQETALVTAREARESFERLIALYGKVNVISLGTPLFPALDRPATRPEIIAEMQRLYRAAEPAIRFTPTEIKADVSKMRIDPATKPILVKLVARGFIAPVGPLAIGPTSGLTPKQFGDALGFFQIRLAQISHLPSPAWTPMLKKD